MQSSGGSWAETLKYIYFPIGESQHSRRARGTAGGTKRMLRKGTSVWNVSRVELSAQFPVAPLSLFVSLSPTEECFLQRTLQISNLEFTSVW